MRLRLMRLRLVIMRLELMLIKGLIIVCHLNHSKIININVINNRK